MKRLWAINDCILYSTSKGKKVEIFLYNGKYLAHHISARQNIICLLIIAKIGRRRNYACIVKWKYPKQTGICILCWTMQKHSHVKEYC